jgi:hypothetical protein
MPTLVGFSTFAALPKERISEKISRRILAGEQGMLVWWSVGAGVHVEPHSHAIAMKDGASFGIAGIWENWKDSRSSEWIRTCLPSSPPIQMIWSPISTTACQSFSRQPITLLAG